MSRSDFVSFGNDGTPLDRAAVPEKIVLGRRRDRLHLYWPDGERALDARRLRAACRCAGCTRARVDGTFPRAFEDTLIAHIATVGDYAISIAFADGHARGIFPWSYLRALASEADAPSPATGASWSETGNHLDGQSA